MTLAKTITRKLVHSYRAMGRVPLASMVVDRCGATMPLTPHPLNGSMQARECYHNAYQLASSHPAEFTYCEGVACSPSLSFPIDHAWVIDRAGRVVDPTWRHADASYFGVPMSVDLLYDYLLASGVYGILPNSYMWSGDKTLTQIQQCLLGTIRESYAGLPDTLPWSALDCVAPMDITVWAPRDQWAGIEGRLRGCFVIDSLLLQEDSEGVRCTVERHDAEYVQSSVIACLAARRV